jgi:signal transduction histidine kinase
MDGLLWLNPSTTTPLLPDGNIFLDAVRAGSRVLQPDSTGELSLSPKENDIRVEIGFSAWCNKENIYLSYRLNNGAWTEVDLKAGAVIQLRSLSPGDYRLLIRKRNGFGSNNFSYREIRFTIRTPWYLQGWFFAGATLLLLGLLYLFLRWRTRQLLTRQQRLEEQVAEKTRTLTEQNEMLEKNNSIKTRLISIISHDLVTPLKFLTVAGKNLIEKRKQMTEALQQETIAEMVNTSQELQLLSTNILNWIKYQNENRRLVREQFRVREPVTQVLGILNSLAAQKNLRIVNEVEDGLEIRQYYEPLKILVYNLLTNAINFSEAGTITIRGQRENGEVVVSVTDEGTGMTPEQVQRLQEDDVIISSANVDNRKGHGLGYLIIKDLIKTMGARLQIESAKGRGTTVRIRIPA